MKPVTQPIDTRGGHLTILKELKKGNAVYCRVWDNDPYCKYDRWLNYTEENL